MNEQLYRRSLGLPYAADALEREIANGFGASSAVHEEEAPTASDLLIVEVQGNENVVRLQEVEFELAQELTPVERIELEAEKSVRTQQRELDELAAAHPRYATALQGWLLTEMQRLADTNVPIDNDMLMEAAILDQIIAEANDEQEDAPFIKIATVMLQLIEARNMLDNVRRDYTTAA